MRSLQVPISRRQGSHQLPQLALWRAFVHSTRESNLIQDFEQSNLPPKHSQANQQSVVGMLNLNNLSICRHQTPPLWYVQKNTTMEVSIPDWPQATASRFVFQSAKCALIAHSLR
jgi:hypothetical protein